MSLEKRLIRNCIALLESCAGMLEKLDDDVYRKTTRLSPRGSIGGHLRHSFDFFAAFVVGVEQGRVDYNTRQRDVRFELDRQFAGDELLRLAAQLSELSFPNAEGPVSVSVEGDGSSWCASTIARELEFLQSHTIHHFSLVAVLLRAEGVEPPEDFGVAPSTLEHWRKEVACAR